MLLLIQEEMDLQQSTKDTVGAPQRDHNIELTINLGGQRLRFENGNWRSQSDLDIAAMEINKVLDERDHALTSLAVAEQQIQDLHKEIFEINSTKKVALDMVTLIRVYAHVIFLFCSVY